MVTSSNTAFVRKRKVHMRCACVHVHVCNSFHTLCVFLLVETGEMNCLVRTCHLCPQGSHKTDGGREAGEGERER